MRWISQGFVLLLMLDAAYVATCQMNRRKHVWWFVCLYWVLLTLKNAVDFLAGCWP